MIYTSIIIIISLLLDGILSLYIDLNSYFLSLFTLTSIYAIYPLLKNKKGYFKIVITTGIIYDFFYTDLLFFHAIIFFIIGKIICYIYKNYNQTIIRRLIYLSSIIMIYETLIATMLFVFRIKNLNLTTVLHGFSHSLILNLIYVAIIYFIEKGIISKKKA